MGWSYLNLSFVGKASTLAFLFVACSDKESADPESDADADTDTDTDTDADADTDTDTDTDADTDTDTDDTGEDTGEWVNPCLEGTTIHIDDNPTSYPSIQSALSVIQDGSVLHVCPGTHYESLEALRPGDLPIPGKIYIVGNSAEDTIIDADGEGPVILTYSDLEISNLTLRGGNGYDVNVAGGDSDPIWVSMGGAIHNGFADLVLDHVIIESNKADVGGGIYVNSGKTYSTILLNGCAIKSNFASGDSPEHLEPYGGGIFLTGISYRLESYDTDWGDGDEDNEPEDVSVFFHPGPGEEERSGFDVPAGASFICDSASEGDLCQILK